MLLTDPGQAAVGPFHRLQRGHQRDQIVGDGSRVRVGEQVIYDIANDAGPAAPAAVKEPRKVMQVIADMKIQHQAELFEKLDAVVAAAYVDSAAHCRGSW